MRLAAAVALLFAAGPAHAICVVGDGDWINRVCFSTQENVPVYGHNILGNTAEWSALVVVYGPSGQAATGDGRSEDAIMMANGIFEDVAPRVVDIDADGLPEAIVVQSDYQLGARLVVMGFGPKPFIKAATPYIGQRNRWLAPIGIADLDGDGWTEIAYIDRPHLARILRVWRYRDGALEPVASVQGLTNHRIGETDIGGGIRNCGDLIEMVTATADWTRVVGTHLKDGRFLSRDLGPYRDRTSFDAALSCTH
jgi:hypothetical protein